MKTDLQIRSIPFELTWEIRHVVMWPDKPISYVKLPNDELGMHFGLYVGEKLVSIVSAFVNGNEAQFRKFATLNEHQGAGYGSKLLAYLMTELESRNISRIWCNARVDKAHFYERFGLSRTQHTFTRSGIDYIVMEKSI